MRLKIQGEKRSGLKVKIVKRTWNEVKIGLRAIRKDIKRKGVKVTLERVETEIARRVKIERIVKTARKGKNGST